MFRCDLVVGLLAVTLSLTICACDVSGGPPQGNDPIDLQRLADVDAWAITPSGPDSRNLHGPVPREVGVVLGFQGHLSDVGTVKQQISRFEINWGDGGGWVDVTAEAYEWDYVWGDGVDPAHISRHTYTLPGTYGITGRVTFRKDGEVVVASNTETVVVSAAP